MPLKVGDGVEISLASSHPGELELRQALRGISPIRVSGGRQVRDAGGKTFVLVRHSEELRVDSIVLVRAHARWYEGVVRELKRSRASVVIQVRKGPKVVTRAFTDLWVQREQRGGYTWNDRKSKA